jgi:hypothetical protein
MRAFWVGESRQRTCWVTGYRGKCCAGKFYSWEICSDWCCLLATLPCFQKCSQICLDLSKFYVHVRWICLPWRCDIRAIPDNVNLIPQVAIICPCILDDGQSLLSPLFCMFRPNPNQSKLITEALWSSRQSLVWSSLSSSFRGTRSHAPNHLSI